MVPPNASKEVGSPAGQDLGTKEAGATTLQFWIASFAVLFALAKLMEWLHGFELTMPVFVVGGVLLAIASNYDKRMLFPFWPQSSAVSQGTEASFAVDSAPSSTTPSMGASTSQTVTVEGKTRSKSQAVQPKAVQSKAIDVEPQLPPFNN